MNKIFKNNLINLRDGINTRHKLKAGNPLVVYQMGKVGSKSIHLSLKNQGFGPLFHLHSIRHDSEKVYSKLLFHHINIERKKTRFITSVREPIARNISSFFQTIELFTNNRFDPKNFNITELREDFFGKYHHVYPLYWFDYEFRNLTGIDVYKYDFLEKNYSIIKSNDFEILILKTETTDELKEAAIQEFLGTETFRLNRYNESEDKEYNRAYKKFKNEINLSEEYINELYKSKYVKHFYNEGEISQFRDTWLKN